MSLPYRPFYALGGSSSFYESRIARIDPDIKAQWVAKLRSGEYEQGRHSLRTNDGKFCCLGVYCDMMELPTYETRAIVRTDAGAGEETISLLGYGRNEDEGSWATIPKPYAIPYKDVMGEYTGVATVFAIYTRPAANLNLEDDRRGRWEAFTLPLLNDNRFTFNQIADVIDYFL